MVHKSSSGLGLVLLAGGIGLATLLLNSEKTDNFLENTVDEVRTAWGRATIMDYVNSLSSSAREELYNAFRILDVYSKLKR
jgi:hypothetical protein